MQPASFIRRTVLERTGWLDPAFSNGKDHELWLRIGLVGVIRHIPSPVAKVRRCPGLSQRPDLAGMKIELTKKFLDRTDLPAPFREPRFRKRAMSNAFLMAAVYSWTGRGGRRETLRYLMSAVRTNPANLFAVTGLFLAHALFNTLPIGCRDTLRRIRGTVRRIVYRR
jgi:hypothetical protein